MESFVLDDHRKSPSVRSNATTRQQPAANWVSFTTFQKDVNSGKADTVVVQQRKEEEIVAPDEGTVTPKKGQRGRKAKSMVGGRAKLVGDGKVSADNARLLTFVRGDSFYSIFKNIFCFSFLSKNVFLRRFWTLSVRCYSAAKTSDIFAH